jgi:hypothetical protein
VAFSLLHVLGWNRPHGAVETELSPFRTAELAQSNE